MALCAVVSAEAALALFNRFQTHDPAGIQAFEYMSGLGLASCPSTSPAQPAAVTPADHYVLVDLATAAPGRRPARPLEAVLEAALEAGEVLDAAIAESEAQRAALWRCARTPEAQKREGASVKNDVSVPVRGHPT